MDYTEQMRRIVAAGARYRVAVVKEEAGECEPFVMNVGREVAVAVENVGKKYGQKESKYQMEVAEAVERAMKQRIFEDEELGSVLVMRNLGILFEPQLHVDIVGMLRRISRNTLTVLLWAGEMDAQKLYFLDKDSEITINQSDINYTII